MTKVTNKSVKELLHSLKNTVQNYVRFKELPKYIANEMDKQLSEAIIEVNNDELDKAYASLEVYVKLYTNYKEGVYTINKPRVNPYYYDELNSSQVFGYLLQLGLDNVDPMIYVRLLDCGRKFKITKEVA
jgi:hypothetical protein